MSLHEQSVGVSRIVQTHALAGIHQIVHTARVVWQVIGIVQSVIKILVLIQSALQLGQWVIALHVLHCAVAVVTCATLWVVVFSTSVHEIALCALCAVQVSSLIGQSTADVQHGAYGRAQEALLYSLHVVLLVPEVVVFLPCVEPDHHCYLNRPPHCVPQIQKFCTAFFYFTHHPFPCIHTSRMIRCVQLTVAVLFML